MPNQPNFPIPSVIDPPKTRCIQLEIPDNDDWMRVFVGLLAQPTYWFNWQRTGDTQGSQCATVWTLLFDKIDWGNMSCCVDPFIRLNPDGSISVSTDGGVTYHTDNSKDPRYTLPQFPPQTGSSADVVKCKTANSIVRQMKDYVAGNAASIGTVTTILGMAALVAGLAVAVFIDPALIPFLIESAFALAAALLTTTSAAYLALFTDDQWSWVLCEVFCKLNEDGTFKADQFVTMQADFDSHFSGNAALTFSSLLEMWQVPGVNRAGSIPTTDNLDCSGCCPGCDTGAWHLYGSMPGEGAKVYGVETGRTSTTVSADSVFNAPGYAVIIWTNDPAICCAVTVDTIPSSGVETSWIPCGGTFPVTTGIYSPADCTYLLQIQAGVPFTVVFTFNAC